jgi:putative transposase
MPPTSVGGASSSYRTPNSFGDFDCKEMTGYYENQRKAYTTKSKSETCAYKLYYHLVFVTKYRTKLLDQVKGNNLVEIFLNICEDKKYLLHGVEILQDHVHILISIPPDISIAEAVKHLKGISSRQIREKHPELKTLPNLWTSGYSVDTLGDKNVAQIMAYLQKQKEHHGRVACLSAD